MNPEIPRLDANLDKEEMLRSIDEFTAAMHKRLEEMNRQEAHFEKRRKPLPEKLYHVTTRENARQIMREGLDPSQLYLENREVVSLSDDIDFAIGVACVTRNTTPKDLVVLEIDTRYLTPSRTHNYLRKADPDAPKLIDTAAIHEVHYESTVPPEAMKIIKHTKKTSPPEKRDSIR